MIILMDINIVQMDSAAARKDLYNSTIFNKISVYLGLG